MYTPTGPEQERVEVWDAPRIILDGVRVQVRPEGETEDVSATVPVKPNLGATVIVEVPAIPAFTGVTTVGLGATEKSAVATA